MHVCGGLCICKCVFGADGYSEGIVEAFWEACENAVKMSHCSWHRTALMDCLHSQLRLCVCVYMTVCGETTDRVNLSRDTQDFYTGCQEGRPPRCCFSSVAKHQISRTSLLNRVL